MAVIWLLH